MFLFLFLNELENYNLKTNLFFFGYVRISSFLWNERFCSLQFFGSVRFEFKKKKKKLKTVVKFQPICINIQILI